MNSNTNIITEADLSRLGKEMSHCMLERYALTSVSVVIGTVLSIRRKNIRHFVSYITIGTLMDLSYGYFYCCKDKISAFTEAKRYFDFQKSLPK